MNLAHFTFTAGWAKIASLLSVGTVVPDIGHVSWSPMHKLCQVVCRKVLRRSLSRTSCHTPHGMRLEAPYTTGRRQGDPRHGVQPTAHPAWAGGGRRSLVQWGVVPHRGTMPHQHRTTEPQRGIFVVSRGDTRVGRLSVTGGRCCTGAECYVCGERSPGGCSSNPYCASLRYSVLRSNPRMRAARVLFPPTTFSTWWM